MKKIPKNDWNWFFRDADCDGVMNGIDCKPYNKKKQDAFVPSLVDNTRIGAPMPPFSNQSQSTPIQPQVEVFPANIPITVDPTKRKFWWI